MVIINKTSSPVYSSLISRVLNPDCKSADQDMAGLHKVLDLIVTDCHNSFVLRLTPDERYLIDRLLELDAEGKAYRTVSRREVGGTPFNPLMERENREKEAKIARIVKMRKQEEAILAETTYAAKDDIVAARSRANNAKGVIEAKKLEGKDATGTVSLRDLMGDNRFIEESMKHSGIRTALASEEGWDVDKINAQKVEAEHEPDAGAFVPQEAPAETVETVETVEPVEPVEPADGTADETVLDVFSNGLSNELVQEPVQEPAQEPVQEPVQKAPHGRRASRRNRK